MSRPSIFLAIAAAGLGSVACSSVPADQRIGIIAPDETQFDPVTNPDKVGEEATPAEYLNGRCGSLDCHGQIARNFRIWGCDGMRLSDASAPGCGLIGGQGLTTPDEYHATFRSLVGLEPAVMTFVVENHGAHPELLTFIRKARGTEAHKGGQLITPGDSQDVCLTSWLAGQTDRVACLQATQIPMFPIPDASTE